MNCEQLFECQKFACFVKIMFEQRAEELFSVSNNVIMVTNTQSTRPADNKDWDLVGGACNGLILSAGRNCFLHPPDPTVGVNFHMIPNQIPNTKAHHTSLCSI